MFSVKSISPSILLVKKINFRTPIYMAVRAKGKLALGVPCRCQEEIFSAGVTTVAMTKLR